jgi:hypothetical protein
MQDPQDNLIFSDDMSFDEKDTFWKIIFQKIKKGVKKRYSFVIIFHLDEEGLDNDDGYSIIIKKEDYGTFLNNFLLWSEELERYETCGEVKTLIKEFETWTKANIS